MKNKLCCLGCILITAFSVLPDVNAQVILIGNYPSTDGAGSTIDTVNKKALVFTTPNNGTSYDINSVVLRLANYTAATSPNPAIGFYTDGGTAPGTLVGNLLTDAPLGGSTLAADYTFLPSGSLTLSANTTYWLLIDAEGGSFQSRSTTTALHSDVGSTGSFMRFPVSGAWASSSVFNALTVNATAVPEPVHYTLGGAVALLAFAGYRRYQASASRRLA
jgi:hypothetical protein